MRQKKRKTIEKETRHQRSHDSLHCPRVKCNFAERHSSKTKQITNWSVSSFKGKLKFFRFKNKMKMKCSDSPERGIKSRDFMADVRLCINSIKINEKTAYYW